MTSYQLTDEWTVVRELGRGGFGTVFEVTSGSISRALKVIPGVESIWRDLLVNEVPAGPWAVPILEAREVDGEALLLMPLAETSLRARLDGQMSRTDALGILVDLAAALAALETAGLVHRDVKPENILRHDGAWKLTDFGEARYAEATTGISTHRFNMTAAYAAPERWLDERATARTDVYSWGIIAYELLTGERPFSGTREELRQSHLTKPPPPMSEVDLPTAGLVKLALSKSPETRPSAAELLRRVQSLTTPNERPGFRALAEVSAQIADTMAQESAVAAERRQRANRHDGLYESATVLLADLAGQFKNLILDNAIVAVESDSGTGLFKMSVGSAQVSIGGSRQVSMDVWKDQLAPFEVIACSDITLQGGIRAPGAPRGRAHSLWFGDIQRKGEFEWYEVAFFAARSQVVGNDIFQPDAVDLDQTLAGLFLDRYHDIQLARPFVPFNYETLEPLAERWAGWIAEVAVGPFPMQLMMPEVSTSGSWRRQGQEEVRPR